MADGALADSSSLRDVDELLPLAMSRPREALAKARKILAGRPRPVEALVAHQTAGIVLRDIGDVGAGIRELRHALRLTRRMGSAEREADVLASLGAALVFSGRTAEAFAAFDRAIELSSGALAGRVLHRRGVLLYTVGRYAAAMEDFRRAVTMLQRAHDTVWTARALSGRGVVYLSLGSPARADQDFIVAGRLLDQSGQGVEVAHTVLNRGSAAFLSGDLPAALAFLDDAAARYQPFGVPAPDLSRDRCGVLLAAGLAREALAEADAAVRDLERSRGRSTRRAELLLMAASCALAAAKPDEALERAQSAHRLFRSQQSAWGQGHAKLVVVQAQFAAGQVSARLAAAAAETAAQLEALHSAEATQAHLLAGRVARVLGRGEMADHHFSEAAQSRRCGPAISRVAGWLAEALRAQAAGDSRQLQIACRRGLEVLNEHRWTLGASELRAHATAQGAELAALAQRHVAAMHRPRLLLTWSERWRATALAVPAVRPPAGVGFDADLAALRQVTSRLEEARRQGEPTASLERDQMRLEKAVRATSLRTKGSGVPARSVLDIEELLDQLGASQLVELADIDGTLQVLLCGDGRVRQITAGSTAEAVRAADFARFALRRLARARPGDDLESAAAVLAAAGPRLEAATLGPAAALLRDGPLVVVPPGRLHGIPWALLPALARRPFSVAPSAGAWLRAHAAQPPDRQHVVLARGPGLVTDGAEVPLAAKLYADTTVLSGAAASTMQVLEALDGAWLAHIAAHGTFRADSPMFSSLRLNDGPLTVYDFEQLHRAPYRLVLSSCDSGVLAPAGADELLGLVSSLLPLGTAGVIAGVGPLNDPAAVPLMVDLHRHLRAGDNLAEALLRVRTGAATDPVQHAAAMSLLMLGAD
ncbi:MAG TPA: CHAT domain-containing tetratricopeptide repeat protein [Streptosporangiaceae bacterium]|nr:CHAT domain-containing tetratricopeptide repeat protein [Streptosporangiaceae bacterium]